MNLANEHNTNRNRKMEKWKLQKKCRKTIEKLLEETENIFIMETNRVQGCIYYIV